MDLSALSDFDLVATHGGFGKASRHSGRAKATLSRRIMALEHSLGVRLIERGTRALRLTEDGAALYQQTHALLGDLSEAGAAISSGRSEPRGALNVSAPTLFSHTCLGALAAEYAALYPKVRLNIRAEDRRVDLVEDGYDVVIRVNPAKDSTLVGRCFVRDRMLLVAPLGLRRPRSTQRIPDVQAVMLANIHDQGPWHFHDGKADRSINPVPCLVLSSLIMIRDAVRAGAGAALLPQSLLPTDPASAGMAVWGTVPSRPIELWALHQSRRLASAKVSTFIDFLCQRFTERWLSPQDMSHD